MKHGLVTLVVIMPLKNTTTFHVLFIVSLLCDWNITTVEINTYLQVKSAKCLCLLPVVLVLLFWSCFHHCPIPRARLHINALAYLLNYPTSGHTSFVIVHEHVKQDICDLQNIYAECKRYGGMNLWFAKRRGDNIFYQLVPQPPKLA